MHARTGSSKNGNRSFNACADRPVQPIAKPQRFVSRGTNDINARRDQLRWISRRDRAGTSGNIPRRDIMCQVKSLATTPHFMEVFLCMHIRNHIVSLCVNMCVVDVQSALHSTWQFIVARDLSTKSGTNESVYISREMVISPKTIVGHDWARSANGMGSSVCICNPLEALLLKNHTKTRANVKLLEFILLYAMFKVNIMVFNRFRDAN